MFCEARAEAGRFGQKLAGPGGTVEVRIGGARSRRNRRGPGGTGKVPAEPASKIRKERAKSLCSLLPNFPRQEFPPETKRRGCQLGGHREGHRDVLLSRRFLPVQPRGDLRRRPPRPLRDELGARRQHEGRAHLPRASRARRSMRTQRLRTSSTARSLTGSRGPGHLPAAASAATAASASATACSGRGPSTRISSRCRAAAACCPRRIREMGSSSRTRPGYHAPTQLRPRLPAHRRRLLDRRCVGGLLRASNGHHRRRLRPRRHDLRRSRAPHHPPASPGMALPRARPRHTHGAGDRGLVRGRPQGDPRRVNFFVERPRASQPR